ncbi:MAG TPA: hypothetical protein VI320_40305 [Terracidiphilus sp.]|jgi:hypothetical protein
MPRFFGHDRTFMQPIVWITTLFMVAFHIGELAALFLFSWKALLLALAPWWAAGSLGIGIGYIGFLPIEATKRRNEWNMFLLYAER